MLDKITAVISKYKNKVILVFIGIMILSAIVFIKKLLPHPPDSSPAAFTVPPPAHGMPVSAKEEVKLPVPLKVFPKKEAIKKMQLPAAIANDPAKHITATATLKPTPGGYTVAAVTDISTGVTDLISKEKPRSLFALGGESEIGALGGITSHGNTGVIFARQDLLRIGAVHVYGAGGVGVFGKDVGYGVFAGTSIKWD